VQGFRFKEQGKEKSNHTQFSISKSKISSATFVNLEIYNPLGQEVKRLIGQRLKAGVHQYQFDGSDLPSGVYYYRLVIGEHNQVLKCCY